MEPCAASALRGQLSGPPRALLPAAWRAGRAPRPQPARPRCPAGAGAAASALAFALAGRACRGARLPSQAAAAAEVEGPVTSYPLHPAHIGSHHETLLYHEGRCWYSVFRHARPEAVSLARGFGSSSPRPAGSPPRRRRGRRGPRSRRRSSCDAASRTAA